MGKQTGTVDRQQDELKVSLATQYVDLRFVILELETVIHLAVRDDFTGRVHQEIALGKSFQKRGNVFRIDLSCGGDNFFYSVTVCGVARRR